MKLEAENPTWRTQKRKTGCVNISAVVFKFASQRFAWPHQFGGHLVLYRLKFVIICVYLSTGNDNIHALSVSRQHILRIDMTTFSGTSGYAEYSDFKLGSGCEKYRLNALGDYCGTAGQQKKEIAVRPSLWAGCILRR